MVATAEAVSGFRFEDPSATGEGTFLPREVVRLVDHITGESRAACLARSEGTQSEPYHKRRDGK